uniref:Uncharacterized protein n=1 Tax=Arundo donax TaxID=35708 RepID=A0A0A9GQV1_ARUDO
MLFCGHWSIKILVVTLQFTSRDDQCPNLISLPSVFSDK